MTHVSHHLLVIHGLEDVVLPWAVVVAGARLDEHHVLLHHLPVGAFELHGQGGGSVGSAAAAVQADAAELWPVGLGGGAAGELKFHRLGDSGSTDALFSFLWKGNKEKLNILFPFIHWFCTVDFTKAVQLSRNLPGCFAPAGTHMVAPYTTGSVSPGDIHGYHW